MVPGSFGCVSAVFAAMTMLAPSCAAFSAMDLPIPRLAPVMNKVRPASFLKRESNDKQEQEQSFELPCVLQ